MICVARLLTRASQSRAIILWPRVFALPAAHCTQTPRQLKPPSRGAQDREGVAVSAGGGVPLGPLLLYRAVGRAVHGGAAWPARQSVNQNRLIGHFSADFVKWRQVGWSRLALLVAPPGGALSFSLADWSMCVSRPVFGRIKPTDQWPAT